MVRYQYILFLSLGEIVLAIGRNKRSKRIGPRMRPGEDASVGHRTNGGFLCTIGWQCNQPNYELISPIFNGNIGALHPNTFSPRRWRAAIIFSGQFYDPKDTGRTDSDYPA